MVDGGTDVSPEDAGCGCHVGGNRSNSTGLTLLGLFGLLGFRARRRLLRIAEEQEAAN
jgi:MYXO-CTERM domain-containing protein